MIVESMSAISGIKTALDIAKGVAALKNEVEINQAVINIQRVLLDAQLAILTDHQTIADLRRQIADIDQQGDERVRWESEKARYVLAVSEMGAFTYDLRTEAANGEVSHRLCATCFENGKKSVLHTTAKHSGGEMVICHNYEKQLQLSKFVQSRKPNNSSFY